MHGGEEKEVESERVRAFIDLGVREATPQSGSTKRMTATVMLLKSVHTMVEEWEKATRAAVPDLAKVS